MKNPGEQSFEKVQLCPGARNEGEQCFEKVLLCPIAHMEKETKNSVPGEQNPLTRCSFAFLPDCYSVFRGEIHVVAFGDSVEAW